MLSEKTLSDYSLDNLYFCLQTLQESSHPADVFTTTLEKTRKEIETLSVKINTLAMVKEKFLFPEMDSTSLEVRESSRQKAAENILKYIKDNQNTDDFAVKDGVLKFASRIVLNSMYPAGSLTAKQETYNNDLELLKIKEKCISIVNEKINTSSAEYAETYAKISIENYHKEMAKKSVMSFITHIDFSDNNFTDTLAELPGEELKNFFHSVRLLYPAV